MIDAKIQTESTEVQSTNETPSVITVSGIIADLENGIDRKGIETKYNLTPAEVKIMFQHPSLKGKRVKKNNITSLRFKLVDDTQIAAENDDAQETTETVDPAQTNLIDAIAEVENSTSDDFDIDNH